MPPVAAPPPSSGSDPLAELARLIGQSDPFSEHRRPAAPQPAAPANWAPPPPGGNGFAPPPVAHVPPAQPYGAQNFGRQPYGSAPLAPAGNRYPPAHDPAVDQDAGYEDEVAYHQNKPDLAPEEADFYEDEHSGRRRLGVMVVAGIFALAVIGAAGAYGYRALFGSSGSSGPPPVIKADSGPSKIVPASNKDTQSNKQINDRVNDRGMGEKLVSREEQPVDIKDKSAGVISQSSAQPLGTGIVGSEPKRVRTIAIHPDQSAAADAAPASAPPTAPARAAAVAPTPPPVRQVAPPPPPRAVANNPPPAVEPEPAPAPPPRQAVARVAPPAPQAAAPVSGNAPLSLSPDASTRAAPPARASTPPTPARTAAVAPAQAAPAAAGGGAGSFAVQVSSQRSEAEAQAAFRDLQGKFPGQLGGKQPLIRQVDLGEKGIYFRAMVGPFANGSDAVALCSSLKAAGGSCIIQKN